MPLLFIRRHVGSHNNFSKYSMPNAKSDVQLKGGATQTKLSQTHPRSHGKKRLLRGQYGWPDAFPPVCLRQESHSFVASVLVDQVCKLEQNASSYYPTLKTNNQPKSPTGSFCTNVWDFLGGNLSEIWWPQTSLKKYWDLWFFCLIHWKKNTKKKVSMGKNKLSSGVYPSTWQNLREYPRFLRFFCVPSDSRCSGGRYVKPKASKISASSVTGTLGSEVIW